jgi:hypothetical protein
VEAESSAASEKRFEDFCSKITRDLAPLPHEAYERNITILGVICLPIHSGAPSAEDYIRWLKSEVDFLPQVFASVDKFFVSMAVEWVLEMVKGGNSIDLEALRRFAASCGTTILLSPRDVKKNVQTITREPFGYKAALTATKAKLRQVNFVS